MKRILLSTVAVLGLITPALAQVNAVPQTGITTGYYFKNTYSSAFFGLAPASSATDVLCITGSATKVVRLASIKLSGTAGTLVTLPVSVLRRATADTGGTAATTTANPGVTTQIASRDTGLATNSSATAVLISYTANPTINDSAPVQVDALNLTLGTTAAATNPIPTIFDFSKDNENNIAPLTLRGVAQQACVNFNTISVSSGLVAGSIAWTEE